MLMTDERLLELALEGDDDSFGELVHRWQKKIYSFIRRYVGSSEEAEDLTQDTFTKAYRNLSRLTDHSSFSSWVYKIALNECRMRFRRKSRSGQVILEDPSQIEIESAAKTPEAVLADKERGDLLRQALTLLPEEQRTVIVMKEYQSLKFHEIADILEIPLSTVKSRMYLGLKSLKRLMEKKL